MDTEDCLSLALSECAIIPSQTVFSEAGFSSLADVKDCVTTASSVNYYFKGPWSLWSQCSCLHQQLGAQLISSSPLQTLVYCYCLNRLPALCNPSLLHPEPAEPAVCPEQLRPPAAPAVCLCWRVPGAPAAVCPVPVPATSQPEVTVMPSLVSTQP